MPNGHGEERDQWVTINSIDKTVARIEQKLDDHLCNVSLHGERPCKDFARLENRVWYAIAAALSAVALHVWNKIA